MIVVNLSSNDHLDDITRASQCPFTNGLFLKSDPRATHVAFGVDLVPAAKNGLLLLFLLPKWHANLKTGLFFFPQDVIKVHFALLRAIDLNMVTGGSGLGKIFLDFKERYVNVWFLPVLMLCFWKNSDLNFIKKKKYTIWFMPQHGIFSHLPADSSVQWM